MMDEQRSPEAEQRALVEAANEALRPVAELTRAWVDEEMRPVLEALVGRRGATQPTDRITPAGDAG